MAAGSEDFAAPLGHRHVQRLGAAMPPRLVFTREGRLLVALTLGMGLAAVNSGNNLLYLIFAMLLSLIIVSGVLSEITLRGLEIRRHETSPSGAVMRAGDASLAQVEVRNTKRRFASISLEVTELLDPGASVGQRRGFVLHLPAGGRGSAWIRLVPARRGVVGSAGLLLTTRFPFGLFSKSRVYPVGRRITVLPAPSEVAAADFTLRLAGLDEQQAGVGSGDEYHGLRDHRPGDDARSIAWKITARRDRLVIREFERPGARRLTLVVANAIPVGAVARAELERAFAHAAGLAAAWSARGWAVGVLTCDGFVAPAAGSGAVREIEAHLAALPVRLLAARTGAGGDGLPFPEVGAGDVGETHGLLTASQAAAGVVLPAADRVNQLAPGVSGGADFVEAGASATPEVAA